MSKISLRQEKLFATIKTVCELVYNLLRTLTKSCRIQNSLRSQAFAAQCDISLSGERSEFWIRQLFVRVRKRLQTSSQTVFIVANSFSCRKDLCEFTFPQIVASVCKTVVNVCQTVVSLCKRFFLIRQCHRPRGHSSSMKSTHWDHLSLKFFLIRQVLGQ